ncbi:hypothetical protein N7495_001249 [Penicillium taxi]|uniref:uncharacterized protein n=1 Tax=Penicillium taxi TaxID=168475 RepID=UPI002544FC24|nr:uncharacterized protein N7495_001249 [Penicillium taxi]KAJ5908567.1 hypothetical protein N7495_001249 [Penicillium taxi]
MGDDKDLHLGPPAQSVSASQTSSSAGDIEAAEATEAPEFAVPKPFPKRASLSRRLDDDSIFISHVTSADHAHSGPPLSLHSARSGQDTRPSALTLTIQPSAFEGIGEIPPGSVRLGPGEFAVTLPMDSRVKSDYENVLKHAAPRFQRFLETFNSGTPVHEYQRKHLQSKIQKVIAALGNVTTHPDLNISRHLTDGDTNLEDMALWAESNSAKFLFLRDFIEIASMHNLHIILAIHGTDKQNLIERYLRGKGFEYTRPREELGGSVEISLVKGSLSFGIHSTDSVRDLFKEPSAIFLLDATFNSKSSSVVHIRQTYTRNGDPLPLIWLLVANTCEHIERCLPDMPQCDRILALLHFTDCLHYAAGDIQDGALDVHENVAEIFGYLTDSSRPWPLVSIKPLPLIPYEAEEASISSTRPRPSTLKRSLSNDEHEAYKTKRVHLGDISPTNDTDVINPSDHTNQILRRRMDGMENFYSKEKAQNLARLVAMESKLQDWQSVMNDLQYRYESRTESEHKLRRERDSLLETVASLKSLADRSKEDISKLRDERTLLNRELEGARLELKSVPGPLADLETAREEVRRLTKENSSLERKSDYERHQAEYTREQYQNASNVAAQAGNEARTLRKENEDLLRRISSNTVAVRELSNKAELDAYIARISELEITLAQRDDFLQKKEEELREIRKNRPSTRSTSTAPRSPKWAAGSRPTSPGLGGNGSGGLPGRGSTLRFSS